jgi:hypothetical protein
MNLEKNSPVSAATDPGQTLLLKETRSKKGTPALAPAVDAYLTGTLDLVMYGYLDLDQLPRSVAALIFYGETLGRNSRQQEVDQLQSDCDRLYSAAARGTFKVPMRAQGKTFAELEFLRNEGIQ